MRLTSVIVCVAVCLQLVGTALAAATFYPLGMLDQGDQSVAYGLSGDGHVVVGFSHHAQGWEAFRWTAQQGMIRLGELPGGSFYSEASDVSFDGSVIVGISADSQSYQAVRWTVDGEAINTEVLCPGHAAGVSDDGTVIAGIRYGQGGEPNRGFRWTAAQGVVDLPDLASGQRFEYPMAISPDGLTIVGDGINPAGDREAWMVVIPEPSTLVLSGVGGLVFLAWCSGRNRRRSRQHRAPGE